MVRAYLVEDKISRFGHQAVNALFPAKASNAAPQPGPRLYRGPDMPEYQPLKRLLESQWIDLLRERVGLPHEQLPFLWDCDFMLGASAPGEPTRFVLCEINVSSVPPSHQAPSRRLSGRSSRGSMVPDDDSFVAAICSCADGIAGDCRAFDHVRRGVPFRPKKKIRGSRAPPKRRKHRSKRLL